MQPGAPAFQGAACEPTLRQWISFIMDISVLEQEVLEFWDSKIQFHIINTTDGNFDWVVDLMRTPHNRIIALGNVASDALNKKNAVHFKLPHPSGRNRQLNDKAYVQSQLEAAKKFIQYFI